MDTTFVSSNIPTWVTLLIQVPLVGVFIYYSLEMSKRAIASQSDFLAALDRRDASYEQRNRATIEALHQFQEATCKSLDRLVEATAEHDRYVHEHLAPATTNKRGRSAG